jgi:hypothetical protein
MGKPSTPTGEYLIGRLAVDPKAYIRPEISEYMFPILIIKM